MIEGGKLGEEEMCKERSSREVHSAVRGKGATRGGNTTPLVPKKENKKGRESMRGKASVVSNVAPRSGIPRRNKENGEQQN